VNDKPLNILYYGSKYLKGQIMNKLITFTLLTSSWLFSSTINVEVSHIKNQKASLVSGLYNIEEISPSKAKFELNKTIDIKIEVNY